MEKKLVYLWSVIVLLSVVLSSALTQDITEYFKVGGSLELRPQPEQTAIKSIVWRHNGDLVAEWVDNESPLTYWGAFSHRTTLNTTTGRLEIRNMGKDDAGLFIVEINNKVQSKSYAARVAKEVVLSSALAQDITEYFKVGGSLELRPQPEQTAITSIVWKHNGELVAEWVDNESPLTYWGVFKGRTTLNTTTGRLEIRNMSKDDAGLFTVEINNKVQSKSYPAKVAKEVSKPTVLIKLSCDGDTTETGPVIYSWKFGDRGWKQREKDITISKTEEIESAETVSCRMENLVGEKESDPVENPLFKKPIGPTIRLIVVPVFLILLVLFAVVGYLKGDQIKEKFCRPAISKRNSGEHPPDTAPLNPENNIDCAKPQ